MLTPSQRCLLAASFIAAAASPALAGELVFNGGFETGNFAGWSVPPNVPNQAHFVVSSLQGGGPSSSHYAVLSSSNLQFISQILPTQAGQDYELSFWARVPGMFPPVNGPFLTVRWEGEFIGGVQLSGPDALIWNRYTFPIHADITGSFLEFGQNAFPGEIHIDDISVVPIPAPSAAPLLLLGSAIALRRRRR